jgi:hypothetical protein
VTAASVPCCSGVTVGLNGARPATGSDDAPGEVVRATATPTRQVRDANAIGNSHRRRPAREALYMMATAVLLDHRYTGKDPAV